MTTDGKLNTANFILILMFCYSHKVDKARFQQVTTDAPTMLRYCEKSSIQLYSSFHVHCQENTWGEFVEKFL